MESEFQCLSTDGLLLRNLLDVCSATAVFQLEEKDVTLALCVVKADPVASDATQINTGESVPSVCLLVDRSGRKMNAEWHHAADLPVLWQHQHGPAACTNFSFFLHLSETTPHTQPWKCHCSQTLLFYMLQ